MRLGAFASLFSVVGLVGCGGTARPRVTDVQIAFDTGAKTSVVSTYSGNNITSMTASQAGTAYWKADVSYSGNKISSIAATMPAQPDWSDTVVYTYDAGKVTKIVRTTVQGTAPDITTTTETTAIEYADGRESKMTWTSGTDSSVTEYQYQDERWSGVTTTQTFGNTTTTTVAAFLYGGNGHISSIASVQDDQTETTTFTIKGDRIDSASEVWGSDTMAYALQYEGDKMSQITLTDTSGGTTSTKTVSYAYETGDVDGMVPTPDMVWGDIFDMKGTLVDMGRDNLITSTAFAF